MDYSKLSDFEINKMVAESLGNDVENSHADSINKTGCTDGIHYHYDYCNNPSDAWPIIFDSEINIQFRHGADLPPMARHCDVYFVDKNPLRAAMIVYLMMNNVQIGGIS